MTKVPTASDEHYASTGSRSGSWLIWLLLLTGVLLFLSWLGWKAWRSYDATSSLLAREDQARALLSNGPQELDAAETEALLLGVRQDVVTLQQEVGFVLPLLPLLRDIEGVGPLAAAAPALLDLADAGSEAAAYGFRALAPALAQYQSGAGGELDLPALLAALQAGRPDLARTALALERVAAARAQIPADAALPAQVSDLLAQVDAWLPLAQQGLRTALVLPELAGADGPRRYLILAQNEDELRPSGGFISGAGLLQVEDGRITALNFQDANKIDAWAVDGGSTGMLTKAYADAPTPLQEFMLLDLFLFRDANYWPDFRASGQKAMDLYAYGRDVPPLDGAIAIDQAFLKLLLQGTGPVKLGDSGEVISSENIDQALQEAWTLQDGASERKAFLGPFAAAILGTLLGGLGDLDLPVMAEALQQGLNEKHLQIYVRDPVAAAMLAANGWDGRVEPPLDHDALLVVDMNVGYNKANVFIERDVSYGVALDPQGGGMADLAVTHRHTGADTGEACWQGTLDEYLARADYAALTNKCYWNYMRVYTPQDSALISGPQHLIPGETWFGGTDWSPETETLDELPGFTTFASWMLVPRGADVRSEFQYTLPPTVTRSTENGRAYALRLIKQAGVDPYPVQVEVTLPAGASFVSASPTPTAREGSTFFFSLELAGDETIELVYK